MGRIDHQVKIRGHRIELGEIESWLLKHGSIKDAVVISKEDNSNGRYICAYIVQDKELTITELRDYLLKNLPEYMIPSYFVKMDCIPLTSNGKVNIKAFW